MSSVFLIALFVLLPLAAGLWLQRREPDSDLVKLLLAFSGAFLLSVTVVHMLPELYERGGHAVGTWVLAFQMVKHFSNASAMRAPISASWAEMVATCAVSALNKSNPNGGSSFGTAPPSCSSSRATEARAISKCTARCATRFSR